MQWESLSMQLWGCQTRTRLRMVNDKERGRKSQQQKGMEFAPQSSHQAASLSRLCMELCHCCSPVNEKQSILQAAHPKCFQWAAGAQGASLSCQRHECEQAPALGPLRACGNVSTCITKHCMHTQAGTSNWAACSLQGLAFDSVRVTDAQHTKRRGVRVCQFNILAE